VVGIVFFFLFKGRTAGNVLVPLPGGTQKITELVLSFDVYEGVRTLYI
jgi:hypothetical protein